MVSVNDSGSYLAGISILALFILSALVPLRFVPRYRMSEADMIENFRDMQPQNQVRGIIYERTGYNIPIVEEQDDPVLKSKLDGWDALINIVTLAAFVIFVPVAYVIAGIGGIFAGFVHQDWGAIFLSLLTLACAVLPALGGLLWWILLMIQPATFNYQLIWGTLGLAVATCGSLIGLAMLLFPLFVAER